MEAGTNVPPTAPMPITMTMTSVPSSSTTLNTASAVDQVDARGSAAPAPKARSVAAVDLLFVAHRDRARVAQHRLAKPTHAEEQEQSAGGYL